MSGHSRYVVLEILHQGADTILYRARREEDGRSVVLKILRRDDASPRALGRLHHEHEVARALDAPVIVKTHAILPLHPAETETDTDGRSAELPQA